VFCHVFCPSWESALTCDAHIGEALSVLPHAPKPSLSSAPGNGALLAKQCWYQDLGEASSYQGHAALAFIRSSNPVSMNACEQAQTCIAVSAKSLGGSSIQQFYTPFLFSLVNGS